MSQRPRGVHSQTCDAIHSGLGGPERSPPGRPVVELRPPDFRERVEKVLEQREVYKFQTEDHGEVIVY